MPAVGGGARREMSRRNSAAGEKGLCDMDRYGIILAGGGGTRFWPLSRAEKPKQFLNLSGKDCLVNETADRLLPLTGAGKVFVVTSAAQSAQMSAVTAGRVPRENIFREPAARGTAACVGYAAVKLQKKYGDGVMIVTPSDAYIKDADAYLQVLTAAADAAERNDCPVIVGVEPTHPATGYGYIHCGNRVGAARKVLRFTEKPSYEKAAEYLASGEYLWNCGIFVWKISVVLERIEKYLPDIYKGLQQIAAAVGTPDEERITAEIYPTLRDISVDYGILEKSTDILAVKGSFGWSDVGSWDALDGIYGKDASGNVSVGEVVAVDCEDSVFFASDRLLTAFGVKDIVVVETADAVMVCPRSHAQDVKKLVEYLKKSGKTGVL